MSDSTNAPTNAPSPTSSAGALLRQARQAQGLHIAALAAAIKVTPRKLELLESDQFDQLPDATFTRALAQTVCRALKVDAAPVLALLPPARGQRLEHVGSGLNAPFRDRPGRMAPNEWAMFGNPAIWVAALLVVGALVVYLMPAHWLPTAARNAIGSGGGAASAPATAASASTTISETIVASPTGSGVASAPAPSEAFPPAELASSPAVGSATTGATPVAATQSPVNDTATEPVAVTGVLQLRPDAQSWIEVTDARGAALISRLVEPGESVGLDGTPPFKLKIGNAGATHVVFRGKPVELTPYVRDNVARFELK
jgi:cytoskeleton protein RodZ